MTNEEIVKQRQDETHLYERAADFKAEIDDLMRDVYSWDKQRSQFYGSSAWTKTSKITRERDHEIDVWHWIKTGEIVYNGCMVHHIEPIADNWDRRLDLDNLISISYSSHGEIDRIYAQGPDHKKRAQELMFRAVNELEYLANIEDDI